MRGWSAKQELLTHAGALGSNCPYSEVPCGFDSALIKPFSNGGVSSCKGRKTRCIPIEGQNFFAGSMILSFYSVSNGNSMLSLALTAWRSCFQFKDFFSICSGFISSLYLLRAATYFRKILLNPNLKMPS